MRTKTLLLTAALVAVGAASSMAQVYSQNAVGYINVTINPGFNLIANQLVSGDTKISTLIPNPPNQTIFYKYTSGSGFGVQTFDTDIGGWDPNPNETLDFGGGCFLKNPTASPFTVTFVGDVGQGTLNNTVPNGFSILSSKVPQSGLITTTLGLPASNQDVLYKYAGGYTLYTFDTDIGGWDPSEPTINVGEAFFYKAAGAKNWSRVFSVN